MVELDLPAGARLTTRGDRKIQLILIVDGYAATGDGRILGPGQTLGAMMDAGRQGYRTSVDASTPMRVLTAGPWEVAQILAWAPGLARWVLDVDGSVLTGVKPDDQGPPAGAVPQTRTGDSGASRRELPTPGG